MNILVSILMTVISSLGIAQGTGTGTLGFSGDENPICASRVNETLISNFIQDSGIPRDRLVLSTRFVRFRWNRKLNTKEEEFSVYLDDPNQAGIRYVARALPVDGCMFSFLKILEME